METDNTSSNTSKSEYEEQPVPETLSFEDMVMEIEFHPLHDLLAVGLITGDVRMFKYGLSQNINNNNNGGGNTLVHKFANLHQESCRALAFSIDGAYLFTGAADQALKAIDVNTGAVVFSYPNAHEAPINTMTRHMDNMLLTGDDEGSVKLWDLRKQTAAFTWNESGDYIASFAVAPEQNLALAASGDGYLAVLHLRKGTLEAISDDMEDGLLSIQIMKGGKKVVVGTEEGIVNIWNWGQWGDISDRFPGHPMSIDAMVKLDESTICTGSSDGMIRVCSIHPNKFLGVLGDHDDFPIESLKICREHKYLASCSHDSTVKFWGIQDIQNQEADEDENEESMDTDDTPTKEVEAPKKRKPGNGSNFFNDLF